MSASFWQNSNGLLADKHKAADSSSESSGHTSPRGEPCQVKANIVKTYQYKINMSYDDLVSQPLADCSCKDQDLDPASEKPDGVVLARAATGDHGMAASPAAQNGIVTSPAHTLVAPKGTQCGRSPTTAVPGIVQRRLCTDAVTCRDLLDSTSAERLHLASSSSSLACTATPPLARCATTGDSLKGAHIAPGDAVLENVGHGSPRHASCTTSIKEYVHFFEAGRDGAGVPKRIMRPAVNLASPLAMLSSKMSHGQEVAESQSLSTLAIGSRSNGMMRRETLRSNPMPDATQQSLIRLSCAASGYGKFSPASHRASCRTAEGKGDGSGDDDTVQSDIVKQVNGCCSREDSNAEATNGHSDSAVTAMSSAADTNSTSTAPDASSDDMHLRTGESFKLKIASEEDRLKKLSQISQEDLDSGLVPEEACGMLRSAIGKAALLVTKKFKQFKGLCDKNVTQLPDERYKTTVEDLQGFWDMVSLQVEDVDRVFAVIASVKENNWNLASAALPETGGTSATPTLSITSKGKVSQRSVKITDDKGRKLTPPVTSQSNKAKEEARQRLLAAKKAMRKNSASNIGDTAQDIVFLGSNGS